MRCPRLRHAIPLGLALILVLNWAAVNSTLDPIVRPRGGVLPSQAPIVALVMSGSARTLQACSGPIHTHLVKTNPHLRFQLFAYLTVPSPITDADLVSAQQTILQSLSLPQISIGRIVVEPDYIAKTAVLQALGDAVLAAGWGSSKGAAMNVLRMYHGIKRAHDLMQSFGTRKVDLVVRIRPDLCLCSDVSLNIPLGDRTSLYLPWHSPSAAFDQFAVGSFTLMSLYASAFTTALAMAQAGQSLHPESVLSQHLTASQVSLAAITSFEASLARGPDEHGRVHMADAFGKLRRDLPSESFPPVHVCPAPATVITLGV